MKRLLLAIVCCVLCPFTDVCAKEYKSDEIKECGAGLMCDLKGNLVTGIERDHYLECDKLTYEISYKNGLRDGMEREYEDGKLVDELPYKNGLKEGIRRSYYKNGNLWEETPYKNDKKDGVYKNHFENGVLAYYFVDVCHKVS